MGCDEGFSCLHAHLWPWGTGTIVTGTIRLLPCSLGRLEAGIRGTPGANLSLCTCFVVVSRQDLHLICWLQAAMWLPSFPPRQLLLSLPPPPWLVKEISFKAPKAAVRYSLQGTALWHLEQDLRWNRKCCVCAGVMLAECTALAIWRVGRTMDLSLLLG